MTSNEVARGQGDGPDPENLSTFFRVLAASFAHARDRGGAPPSPGVPKDARLKRQVPRPAPRRWPRPILLVPGLFVVLAWITPLLLAAREVVVPDTLVGGWKTSAPLYANRGFTITKTTLMLKVGLGRANESVHPITRVRITHSGEAMVHTIEYLVEQAANEFSFRLSPGPPPVIRSVNQPEVEWRREDDKVSPSLQALHSR